MNREACIEQLSACAADQLSLARQLERDASGCIDPITDDMRAWAGEARVYAGACIAAINHLNGVSPE